MVNRPIKMVHYDLVKVTINVLDLAEVIIKAIVRYHGLPDSIMGDCSSVFTLKSRPSVKAGQLVNYSWPIRGGMLSVLG